MLQPRMSPEARRRLLEQLHEYRRIAWQDGHEAGRREAAETLGRMFDQDRLRWQDRIEQLQHEHEREVELLENELELRGQRARWPCLICGGMPLPEPEPDPDVDERLRPYYGYDPCLGCLPGVKAACCGHGDTCRPYVMLADGETLYDGDAFAYFHSQGVGPKRQHLRLNIGPEKDEAGR